MNSERVEVRIPAERKAVLLRAASRQGRSLTELVLASAARNARRVLRETAEIELSARDQVVFVEALARPPAASAQLVEAARRYRGRG